MWIDICKHYSKVRFFIIEYNAYIKYFDAINIKSTKILLKIYI